MQHLEKGSDMIIRLSHEQILNSEGGDGFGKEIVVLHEIGECLAKVIIASKHPFDVFGVGICMVEELTGVTVGIFRFGWATRMEVFA